MKRKILTPIVALLLGVLGYGAYVYANDHGRKTTDPVFENLAGSFVDGALHYPLNPDVKISFTPEFQYLGGQKFVLYGNMDVEQHMFAKPNADGGTESAIFVQFESVRADIDWQYDYSGSPLREQFGPYDFFTDTSARLQHPIFRYGRPGSDGYMSRKFLAKKGFPAPKNSAYARLVHLPTEDRRSEMLIVFLDDLSPTGFSSRDLRSGGDHVDEWPALSEKHLAKLRSAMRVERAE